MWATVLLHNVDTLEVYEEAIRQSVQDLEHHTTPHEAAANDRGHQNPPPAHTIEHRACTNGAGAGGRIRSKQPKPANTIDPAKQQR